MKISPFSLLIVTAIPFALFSPRSEAIMQKESFRNNKNSSIELIAMAGCHGQSNSLKRRAEKAEIQAELKKMVDELNAKDSK